MTQTPTIDEILTLSRKYKVKLRGQSDDVSSFGGYSFAAYTYVAVSLDLDEMWEGTETGNFLPVDCYYVIRRKGDSARETASRLVNEVECRALYR